MLLESAAIGRACIGSNINGTKDIIEDGVNGYLFEAGNANSLVEKIEDFIQLSPEKKVKMGKAGRVKVEQEFDRKIIIKKYCDEVAKV